jgi:hypothetical protein
MEAPTMMKPVQPALEAWKQQIDAGWRMIEAITEASRRTREIQLEAAVAAHAGMEASRKLLAQAQDVQELWRIQSEWLSRSFAESMAYWQRLQQAALETQAALGAGLPAAAPAVAADGGAMAQMMDNAYRQWLQATQQFYSAPLLAQTRQPA